MRDLPRRRREPSASDALPPRYVLLQLSVVMARELSTLSDLRSACRSSTHVGPIRDRLPASLSTAARPARASVQLGCYGANLTVDVSSSKKTAERASDLGQARPSRAGRGG